MARVHFEGLLSLRMQILYYSFLDDRSSHWRALTIQNINLLTHFYMARLRSEGPLIFKTLFRFFRVGIYFKELLSFRLSIFSHGTRSLQRATIIQNTNLLVNFYMVRVHSAGLLSFRTTILSLLFTRYEFIFKGYYHSEYEFVCIWQKFILKDYNYLEYQSSDPFLHGTKPFWRATIIQNTNLITYFHVVRVHPEGLTSVTTLNFLLNSRRYELILRGYCYRTSYLFYTSSFWRGTIIQNTNFFTAFGILWVHSIRLQ